MEARQPNIRPFVIALTGGPCAGKTTLLELLRQRQTMCGRKLLFVPEAATILVGRGFVIGENVREFQTETLRLQLQLEAQARKQAAQLGQPCAIICDRGTLDGAGYCTPAVFADILRDCGRSRTELARSYDLVIHLVSTAVEAPDAYTVSNNEARHESLEEAIAQEHRTFAAWQDHPHRVAITSTEGFTRKMESAIAAIEHALSNT